MGKRPSAHPSQGQPPTPPQPHAIEAATPLRRGGWSVRGALQRQRLAEWMRWTRKERLRMSLRVLSDAALADGMGLSYENIRFLEQMRERAVAAKRQRVPFEIILWLLDYSGQTLGDLERWLRGGDDTQATANDLAERARVQMLWLSDERQRAVLDFIRHERALDDLEGHARGDLTTPDEQTAEPAEMAEMAEMAAATATADGLDADTEVTLADMQRGLGVFQEARRTHARRRQSTTETRQENHQVTREDAPGEPPQRNRDAR